MKLIEHQSNIEKDFYKLLGVERTATKKQIRAAFRRLSKLYHPDTNNGDAAMFILINEAYETLMDDDKRYFYDTMKLNKKEMHEAIQFIIVSLIPLYSKGITDAVRVRQAITFSCDEQIQELIKHQDGIRAAIPPLNKLLKDMEESDNYLNKMLVESLREGIANNDKGIQELDKQITFFENVKMLVQKIEFKENKPVYPDWFRYSNQTNATPGPYGGQSIFIQFG